MSSTTLPKNTKEEDNTYQSTSQIDRSLISILWHEDYYDGYLSGMCLYRGKMHYFKGVDEGEVVYFKDEEGFDEIDKDRSDKWWRRFVLFELTDLEVVEATRRHDLFRKHVGTHTDYDSDSPQRREIGKTHPQSEWNLYYDQAKEWGPLFDQANRNSIGWFEE